MSQRILFQASDMGERITQALNSVHSGLPALVQAAGVHIVEYEATYNVQRPFSESLPEAVCVAFARDSRGYPMFALRVRGTKIEGGRPTVLECSTDIYAEGLRSPEGTDVLAHAWMVLLNELDPVTVHVDPKDKYIFDVVDAHMLVEYD